MSRLVSALALAFALTAQVSTLVHMGAVRHEACAEHGELVESSDVSVDDEHAPQGDTATEKDAHDHCLLATTPSMHSAAPVILAQVVSVTELDVAVLPPPTRVVAATLLRSAPKTSPPLA